MGLQVSQQGAYEELAREAHLMTTTIRALPPPSTARLEDRKAFLKSQLDGLMWVTVLDALTMIPAATPACRVVRFMIFSSHLLFRVSDAAAIPSRNTGSEHRQYTKSCQGLRNPRSSVTQFLQHTACAMQARRSCRSRRTAVRASSTP